MTTMEVKKCMTTLNITTTAMKNALKTIELSKEYIKKVIGVSVLNILYHRLPVTDEDAFQTRKFGTLEFKSFNKSTRNVIVRSFYQNMKGTSEAIDKNYLKELHLHFVKVATCEVVETYKFTLTYTKGKKNGKKPKTILNLQEYTSELLQNLGDLANYKKFSKGINYSIELRYTDDTPGSYEPHSFGAIDPTLCLIEKVRNNPNLVIMGKISTGFNTLKLRAQGRLFNLESSRASSVFNDVNTEIDEYEGTSPPKKAKLDERKQVENGVDKVPPVVLTTENFTEDLEPNTKIQIAQKLNIFTEDQEEIESYRTIDTKNDLTHVLEISSDFEDLNVVKCCCDISEDFGLELIECNLCKAKFHAPCQGYLEKTAAPIQFKCTVCIDNTDDILPSTDPRYKAISRFRLIIGYMYKYKTILADIEPYLAEVLKTINKNTLFSKNAGGANFDINSTVVNKFFKKQDKEISCMTNIIIMDFEKY